MGQRSAPAAIRVIGFFSASAPQVSLFESTADPCGAAQGRFTLFGCGDTIANPWRLQNDDFANSGHLQRIDIDLIRGGHVFDVTDPSPGTHRSDTGRTFELSQNTLTPNDVVTATYSRQIVLQNANPLGDVWGYLSIDLTGITSQGGLGLRDSLDFYADTDPVPVPAALPLLCTAIAGLAWVRRRRANAVA